MLTYAIICNENASLQQMEEKNTKDLGIVSEVEDPVPTHYVSTVP
jgi:hypothetical protein